MVATSAPVRAKAVRARSRGGSVAGRSSGGRSVVEGGSSTSQPGGVAIQGVGERDGCRPKLAQAAHEGRAQISPVWGLVGTRGRRSLRAGVLPMRPQEGFEAAIREPEEVLGADHIAAKLVQGKARFA